MARRRENLIAFRTREGSELERILMETRRMNLPIAEVIHRWAEQSPESHYLGAQWTEADAASMKALADHAERLAEQSQGREEHE